MSAAVTAYWVARERDRRDERRRQAKAERRPDHSGPETTHAEVESESESEREHVEKAGAVAVRKRSISASVRGFFRGRERKGKDGRYDEIRGVEGERRRS